MTTRRWSSDVSAQNDLLCRQFAPIDVRAGIVIGAKCGTFEGNSRKQSASARVAENLCSHVRIRVRRGIASHGARCYRSIAAQLDFALENGLCSAVIHDQQDEIRSLSADLES